jgi:hypothetical protein
MRAGVWDYFRDLQNYVDLSEKLLFLVFAVMRWLNDETESILPTDANLNVSETDQNYNWKVLMWMILNVLLILLALIHLMLYLMVYEAFFRVISVIKHIIA